MVEGFLKQLASSELAKHARLTYIGPAPAKGYYRLRFEATGRRKESVSENYAALQEKLESLVKSGQLHVTIRGEKKTSFKGEAAERDVFVRLNHQAERAHNRALPLLTLELHRDSPHLDAFRQLLRTTREENGNLTPSPAGGYRSHGSARKPYTPRS